MSNAGRGTTIVFATSAFTGQYIEIGGTEQTLPRIDDSYLGLADKGFMTFLPGDLVDPGEFECEVIFASSTVPFMPSFASGEETVTITYPVPSGSVLGATLAGTAFVSKRTSPVARNNELLTLKLGVSWTGKTGPTFTQATSV